MSKWLRKEIKVKWFIENYRFSLVFLIIFLFLWHFATIFFAIPEYILPSPLQILTVFKKSSPLLIKHSLVTLHEILLGLAIGIFIGFVLAIAFVSFNILRKTIYPLIIAIQGLPKVALAPLFIIWFGFGMLSKIILISLMVIFPILVNTSAGLVSVQTELLDLLKSLRASKLQILLKIRLPSSIPYFFIGLKSAAPSAVIGAVFAEYVGSDRGLGYVLMLTSVNLDTSRMFAAFLLLATINLTIFGVICLLERIVLTGTCINERLIKNDRTH
jgi:NitT/TauT family transport system permease protein